MSEVPSYPFRARALPRGASPPRRLILVSLLALAASFAYAQSAKAITFDFCGTSSSPVFLSGSSAPNDRCVDRVDRIFSYVRGYPYQATYSVCAIVKEYSTGLGHNETAPACAFTTPPGYQQSTCSAGYSCTGYATITDGQSAAGEYWGFAKSP